MAWSRAAGVDQDDDTLIVRVKQRDLVASTLALAERATIIAGPAPAATTAATASPTGSRP